MTYGSFFNLFSKFSPLYIEMLKNPVAKISWQEKLRASAIHLGISLCIAALAAFLVFGLWFPYPYRELSGGRELFLLMLGVDVVLGPLLTFVIFNSKKRMRERLLDFSIIGALQLTALGYGLWTVYESRPVHLVFEHQRMVAVAASDLEPALLVKALLQYQSLPVSGPTLLSIRTYKDENEKSESELMTMMGVPPAAQPELWQPYSTAQTELLKAVLPIETLRTRFSSKKELIDQSITATGKSADQLGYLPLQGRNSIWTVLIDTTSAQPVGFIPLDPS